MSASEKLRALGEPKLDYIGLMIALPQIIAVVEAAEELNERTWNKVEQSDLSRVLAALDEVLPNGKK